MIELFKITSPPPNFNCSRALKTVATGSMCHRGLIIHPLPMEVTQQRPTRLAPFHSPQWSNKKGLMGLLAAVKENYLINDNKPQKYPKQHI